MLALLTLLVFPVIARPSDDLRIIFNDEQKVSSLLSGHQCDVEAGRVHWLEDGGCYQFGERGPCRPGQTLQLLNTRPGCGADPQLSKCHQTWEVAVEDGDCASLLSSGPCQPGHWVVLDPLTLTGRCEARPCPGSLVWLGEQCSCLGEEEDSQVCGEHSGLVWAPTGQGVCVCDDGYYAHSTGRCHQLHSRGPCQEGQVWLLDDSQATAHCAQNDNQSRIFELLSSKSNRGNSGTANTAQAQNCFVDENGKCRKTLNIRGRFGEAEEAEAFQDWLRGFKKRDSDCQPVLACEGGGEGGEGVLWSDGECYQLASTGPCQPGHWLVLADSGRSLRCQRRSCPEEEVWWSPSCSCFPLAHNRTLRPKTNLESPCEESERLLISPYGDGVCAYIEDFGIRIFELLSSSSHQSSEAATRRNCFLDESGKCRKTLNIRGRIDRDEDESKESEESDEGENNAESKDSNESEDSDDGENNEEFEDIDESKDSDALQDLLTWLEQFPKPSGETECEVRDNLTVEQKESDCFKQDKVLFEDGSCYNLLERGPCSEQSMWLVMVMQADGVTLAPQCRPRRCGSSGAIWEPQSCECLSSGGESPCAPGERLYEDIFGAGVCGCKEGHEVWPETGECQQVGGRGPCQQGETFTDCTEALDTRVFDIIPSAGQNNIQNMNRVTKETCVLDAKGRCRRKITINRAGTDDNQSKSEEFRSWLGSFIVRAPETFNCSNFM